MSELKESPDWLLQRWLDYGAKKAPSVVDFVHGQVHEGKMFHAGYTATVANEASLDLLLVTAAVESHATWEVFAGGQVNVYLYEDPAIDAEESGTAVAVFNMNRTSENESDAVVTHTPTVTAVGDAPLINGRILPGGTSPTTRVGGGIRQGVEWILAPETAYLLRATNTSGGAIVINIGLEWYEEAVWSD